MSKSESIKKTLKATKERRKTQSCKVYTCKIDYSHLSNIKRQYINKLFLEAKWLRNYILGKGDIFNSDYKYNTVTIVGKDKVIEERSIENLSSQMRQSILDQIKSDIKGIAALKRKGFKVVKQNIHLINENIIVVTVIILKIVIFILQK